MFVVLILDCKDTVFQWYMEILRPFFSKKVYFSYLCRVKQAIFHNETDKDCGISE